VSDSFQAGTCGPGVKPAVAVSVARATAAIDILRSVMDRNLLRPSDIGRAVDSVGGPAGPGRSRGDRRRDTAAVLTVTPRGLHHSPVAPFAAQP